MSGYLIAIPMIILGSLLLIIAYSKGMGDAEQSLVMAYSFLLFGFIYIVYKMMRKS
ncbi:hypothetical protein M3172_04155 [Mesobacillus subterraneus]|uniref:hypothetical protein n=1 Tax=Mesobacillus subterraneus TaxID=285983 RepID=UPI002041A38F|nr:hypothetical protein [Mesobacillus subterraneus]MCM3572368.1 hypothetical protein [Mesobacillus subterraneus]